MSNYDEIYQNFIGKDKIQAISIREKNGGWALKYKEGKKFEEIECKDRETLDKLLIEFGGKNPETCSAPDEFLELSTWTSENLHELGHQITKIRLSATRIVRNNNIDINIPENCGYSPIMNAKKTKRNVLNFRLLDRENTGVTLAFKKREEFDNLCNFIQQDNTLKKLTWHVMILGTESRETGDHCVWKRLKAGDGTKRMVLELIGLNGTHYTECVRQALFNAAGDMFDVACQRVSLKKKKEQTMEICMFAAEEGKIDMSKLETI